MIRRALLLSFLLALSACGSTSAPPGISPVTGFQVERYLGDWYEIARLDHSFERGMSRVSANYQMRDDGGVTVINRGWLDEDKAWKNVEGKAYFVQTPDIGHLKVSFFGPFYGAYVIFDLDHDGYQYALVSGEDRSYFWLLARTPQISDEVKEALLSKAQAQGFDTSKLIHVNQSPVTR